MVPREGPPVDLPLQVRGSLRAPDGNPDVIQGRTTAKKSSQPRVIAVRQQASAPRRILERRPANDQLSGTPARSEERLPASAPKSTGDALSKDQTAAARKKDGGEAAAVEGQQEGGTVSQDQGDEIREAGSAKPPKPPRKPPGRGDEFGEEDPGDQEPEERDEGKARKRREQTGPKAHEDIYSPLLYEGPRDSEQAALDPAQGLEEGNNPSVQKAEAEIAEEVSGLSHEEKARRIARDRDLIERWKNRKGNPEDADRAAEELIGYYDNFIKFHAKIAIREIPSSGIEVDDVIQEGRVRFLSDVRNWDSSRGILLLSYVGIGTIRSMRGFIEERGFSVRVPDAPARVIRELKYINGRRHKDRKPSLTDAEVGEQFGLKLYEKDAGYKELTVETIRRIDGVTRLMESLSKDEIANLSGFHGRKFFVDQLDHSAEILGDPPKSVSDLVTDSLVNQFLSRTINNISTNGANQTEKESNAIDMLHMRMWLGLTPEGDVTKSLKQSQIAEIMGTTPQNVSLRLKKGIRKLILFVNAYMRELEE